MESISNHALLYEAAAKFRIDDFETHVDKQFNFQLLESPSVQFTLTLIEVKSLEFTGSQIPNGHRVPFSLLFQPSSEHQPVSTGLLGTISLDHSPLGILHISAVVVPEKSANGRSVFYEAIIN